MTIMTFPTRFTHLVVDGVTYKPDADNMIVVENSDHIPVIKRLGGTVPSAKITRVEVAPPPSKPKAKKAAKPEAERTVEAEAPVESEAEAPVDGEPEAPVEEPSATLEVTGSEIPTEDMTRPKMIEWLRENGAAVNTGISKTEAWKAIQAILSERGN